MVVFTNEEKSECYEYTWNEKNKYFICWPCKIKHKVSVYARSIKNDENQKCIELGPTAHKCAPINFVPEDLKSKIVKESDFMLYETVLNRRKLQRLFIFDQTNKNYGFNYSYAKHIKKYWCIACRSKTKLVTAKVFQNENGQNYVELGNLNHVCKAVKYSDVIQNTNRLLVMAPNYHLMERKVKNKVMKYLIVFTNDDKSECFKYTWSSFFNNFVCYSCCHKAHVFAHLIKNDKNVECVELGPTAHKCSPIKFIPEKTPKIVQEPDFKLYETIFQKKKLQKMAIFASNNKRLGYIYSYHRENNFYVCCKCKGKKQHVVARLYQNGNGENYVELNHNEHVCALQKL
uniref:Uncharacterized protein n=1 Tax=Panagrolaimus sp. ES5 TaxID=591445 RepID=A0AC34G3L0_9BILA